MTIEIEKWAKRQNANAASTVWATIGLIVGFIGAAAFATPHSGIGPVIFWAMLTGLVAKCVSYRIEMAK